SAGFAGFYGLLYVIGDQLNRLDSIIVRRNWIVYDRWVSICIYQCDNRQAELTSFLNSIYVVHNIKHKNSTWASSHVFDAAIDQIHSVNLFLEALDFKLTVLVSQFARSHLFFKGRQMLDTARNGGPISEHTAQ